MLPLSVSSQRNENFKRINKEGDFQGVTQFRGILKLRTPEIGFLIYSIGATAFYVRCGCPEQAKTLANVKIFGDGKVLADEEERQYWEKANQDREEKLGGKVQLKASRVRGKDKVVRQFKQGPRP
jgi:hypothetical protein